MYAVVDIAGQQFKVEAGQKIFVHRLASEVGANVSFDKVLLTGGDNGVKVTGLDNSSVSATILQHVKGDKVIVFKKKRRKGYQKRNGHRQSFTQIRIEGING